MSAQIATVAIRFFGCCLGLLLLFFAPFALNGTLASDELAAQTATQLWVSALTFAVPGATLLVPFRIALHRPARAAVLLLSYCASLALAVRGPLQSPDPISAVQAIPAGVLGLNMFAFWRLRVAEGA